MRRRIDHDEVWRRYLSGGTPAQVARAMNRQHGAVWRVVYKAGGIPPRQRRRREGRLTASEREDISRGLAAGESLRAIARQFGGAPSAVSREVAGNGGRRRYRAGRAEARPWQQACRPQLARRCGNGTDHAALGIPWTEDGYVLCLEPRGWMEHAGVALAAFALIAVVVRLIAPAADGNSSPAPL